MIKRSPAAKKPRGPGRRFVKGDPRINRKGPLNAALQSYEMRMRNAAPGELPPEEFIAIVADDVRHHRPGAREFWGKYIVGEPAVKNEHTGKDGGPIEQKLIVEFVETRG